MKRDDDYFEKNNLIAERFKIVECLGKGAMGKVYKAYDTELEEYVAIKTINKEYSQNKHYINMFRNEVKTSLALMNANIIRVRDVHRFNEQFFIVMDFVEGIDLEKWMRKNSSISSRNAKEMYGFIKPILNALNDVHKIVIHRDIKPANIMLSHDGTTYLMDFGIATVIKGSKITDELKEKKVGTPAYMSPEQKSNVKDIDHRSDIFSMGIVFYELLTARRFNRNNIVFASYYNNTVSSQLDNVLLKMLADNPRDRYDKVIDIIDDIDTLFRGGKEDSVTSSIGLKEEVNLLSFVTIPEGYFYRGSGLESTIEVEKPRRKIYLDSYKISIYCVTNSEYLNFLKENNSSFSKNFEEICHQKPHHPITDISWDDALLYCKWMGGRLPTEAEWEKASKGIKNRIYPWGNEFCESCCNVENIRDETVSVNSFDNGISQYGCYQMAGNVWEWCLDDFIADFYRTKEGKNPNPLAFNSGDDKVIRGGSFDFVKTATRTSYRYYARKNHKRNNIGFRVVLEGIVYV